MDPFNALRATYYIVLFGIDIAQVPSSVRHSLELVRTCYADVQHLIELRQTYLVLLEKRPVVLDRVNSIIGAATTGLQECCAIVEKSRPEANKGRVPFRQRVEWIFFDEKEIRAQEAVISRHHATVLAELNFLRQIALLTPAPPQGDGKSPQKPEEAKVFDNVALLGDLFGGPSAGATHVPAMNPPPAPMTPRGESFVQPPPAYTAQPVPGGISAPAPAPAPAPAFPPASPFPSFSQSSIAPMPSSIAPMPSSRPIERRPVGSSSSAKSGVVFNSHDTAGLSLMFGGAPPAQPPRSQSDFTGASMPGSSSRPEPPRNATDQPFTQQNLHGSWGAPPPAQSPDPRRASQPQGLGLHDTGQPNAGTWQGFGGGPAPNPSMHRHSIPTSTTPTPPQKVPPQSKGWANWEHDLTKVQRVAPDNAREQKIQSNMDTRVKVSPLLKPQTPAWSQDSRMSGQLQPMASVQTLRSEFMGPVSSVGSPSPMSSYAMPDHPGSRPHSVMTQSHTPWNLPAGGGARGGTPGNVPLLSTIPPNMMYGQSLNTTMSPPMPQMPQMQQPAQPTMQSQMQSQMPHIQSQMQPPMPPTQHNTSNSISSMSSFSSLPPQAFPPQHMAAQHMAAQHMATHDMQHAQWPPAQGSMPPSQTMWELDGSSVDHVSKLDHAGHAHYAAPVVEQIHELSSVQFAPDPVELPATSYRYER